MSDRRGHGQGRGRGDFVDRGGSRGNPNAGRGSFPRQSGDFGAGPGRGGGAQSGMSRGGHPRGHPSAGRGGGAQSGTGRGGVRGPTPGAGFGAGHAEFVPMDFPAIGTFPAAGPSRSEVGSTQEPRRPTETLAVKPSIEPEPPSVSEAPTGESSQAPASKNAQKRNKKRGKAAATASDAGPGDAATVGPSGSESVAPEEPAPAGEASFGKMPTETESASVSVPTEAPTAAGDISSGPKPTTGQKAHQRKKKRPKAVDADLETKFSQMTVDKIVQLPARPDKGGTAGRPVRLFANCFDISIKPKKIIMYQLEPNGVFAPDKEGKKRRITATMREQRTYLKQLIPTLPPGSIYDGGFTVCCDQPIPDVSIARIEREATIDDPDGDRKLFLKYFLFEVKVVEMEDLLRYLDDPNASVLKIPQHAIRVLDCILKLAFKGQFETLGRAALISKQCTRAIESKMMDIHRGFITSARPQWKLRINIDMSFTAFLSAGNLADVLYNKHGNRLYSMKSELLRDIDRIRVETNSVYKEKTGQHRKYTLHGISNLPANQYKIENLNQTVSEYFAEKYGIKLQYPDLPCAKVNPKRDVYLPLELLNILPYQSPNASKADVASEIIRLAAIRPKDRFEEIKNFLSSALRSSPPILTKFGIQINNSPVTTDARVLDPPRANFGGPPVPLRRGNWEFPSFHTPANSSQVIPAIVFSVPPHPQGPRARGIILNGLGREGQRYGLNLQIKDGHDLPPHKLCDALQRSMDQGYRLAILVLHDDANYPQIKRLSDLELGIRTQCVRERTLGKPRVMPNLLLKINCKLSGINWTIPDLVDSSRSDERFIVMGADVTHPSPTQRDAVRKSVAAVTASYSLDLMRYAAVVRQQETTLQGDRTTREIIDNMEAIVTDLLTCYGRAQNGHLPTKLMFYRDGVSEGQFQIVVTEELHAIQRACRKLRQDYEPAITYIVVQKRHRLRFMPQTIDPRNRTGNVEPGTVIDRDVVHHRDFDFYLSSAEGIQGTCKPAYYHVLYDDSNWSSNALQAFTFYLCHAYQRCSRSVSYPAPTYYAHLAAARAREWLTGSSADVMKRILDSDRNEFRVHESQVTGMFYM